MVQDFVHLPLTVRDNVLGPDQAARDGLLDEAARRSGLDDVVARLEAGWDTILSRQLAGGTELSGGEWQKVALARALYALADRASVLALDEPTASMDIEAEQAVYEAIIDTTAGRTLILVSHRFGTVRRADDIFVLDAGSIAESGSHDQLTAAGGLYARMFDAQARIVR
jgi:ATP-binding cassette subfamily B protein